VIDAYLDGTLRRVAEGAVRGRPVPGLDSEEAAILPLLRPPKRSEAASTNRKVSKGGARLLAFR